MGRLKRGNSALMLVAARLRYMIVTLRPFTLVNASSDWVYGGLVGGVRFLHN